MHLIKVLYDGWPLIDRPNGPAALHLLAILAHLPDAVQPVVALPDTPPAWLRGTPVHIHPMPGTPAAHLRWEQQVLPRLARQLGADLLHLTSTRVSLLNPANSVVTPCEFEFWDSDESDDRYSASKTLGQRLLESLGRGGFSRARHAFWPSDLPAPAWPVDWITLPPVLGSRISYPARERANRPDRTVCFDSSVSCPASIYPDPISSTTALVAAIISIACSKPGNGRRLGLGTCTRCSSPGHCLGHEEEHRDAHRPR